MHYVSWSNGKTESERSHYRFVHCPLFSDATDTCQHPVEARWTAGGATVTALGLIEYKYSTNSFLNIYTHIIHRTVLISYIYAA